ncbi:MAG TPA: hypothetical protein VGC49_10790 [Solirubrobacterales bacterium]|jgi:hypothetical protein
MIATIIEVKALLDTVLASLVAAVGVTFAFSVGVWGVAEFVELSRNERPVAAAAAATVAALALACVAAALVAGIIVMTSK